MKSWPESLAVALAFISLVGGALAAGLLRDSWWGFHLAAFAPTPLVVAVVVILLGALAWFLFGSAELPDSPLFLNRPARTTVVVALVGGALFWGFRSEQRLLGDAQPLATDLVGGQNFHPRQPLTYRLQQSLYQQLDSIFAREGREPVDVAHRTVAVGSVVAGMLFCAVAMGLGGTIAGSGTLASLLVALLLVSQGFALLFFGYVENYTFYTLAIGMFVLEALLYLRGRTSLMAPGLTLLLAVALHLSAVALVPAFAVLAGHGLTNHRRDTLRDLGLLAVGTVGTHFILSQMFVDYGLTVGVRDLLEIARRDHGGGAGLSYTWSATHLRDFFNSQWLLGPVSALVATATLVHGFARGWREPEARFLAVATLTFLAGSFLMSEPLLGYARDWDLFAPAGVVYATTVAYFVARHGVSRERVLLLLLAVSATHTTLWVANNHVEARALERFKTLPLGLGRTQVVVGNWYYRHQETAQAQQWFHAALEENPYNANAFGLLGAVQAGEGNLEEAAASFQNAVGLRPDKQVFRNNLVAALMELDRAPEALPHLRWLVNKLPNQITYLRLLEQVLTGGEPASKATTANDELRQVRLQLLAHLEQQLVANSNDVSALIEAGILMHRLGHASDAVALLRRAQELAPNHPRADRLADWIYSAQQDARAEPDSTDGRTSQ